MTHLSRRPRITSLNADDQHLYAQTHQGHLPLYVFTPLRAAILCGQGVPFAATWPEHLKLFVYGYAPVPRLDTSALPADLAQLVGWQPRDPNGLRPWEQATYKGWPLYTASRDQPGEAPRSTVPDLFELATLDMEDLPNHNHTQSSQQPPPTGP